MKYIFRKLMMALPVLAFSVSCDFLDRPPLDRIGNGSYWKTESDFQNYTLQFYPSFRTFGGGQANFLGPLGDDAFQGSDFALESTNVHAVMNGSTALEATNGKWNWTNIRAVNIFFENLETSPVDKSKISQYIGEAHFFKAFYYFEKVVNFGDVPWFTETLYMDSEELYKPRDPRNEVVDSILFHLDRAIECLKPLSELGSLGGNNRLSKEAALLFKSRVALFEGSWEKYHAGDKFGVSGADPDKYFRIAADAAEELMSGKYKVGIYNNNKPADDYGYIFSQEDMSKIDEVILWKRYDVGLDLGNQFQPFVSSFTAAVSISDHLVRNYLGKDGKPIDYDGIAAEKKGNAFLAEIGKLCDPRLGQTIWLPGQLLSDNGFNVNGQPKYFDKPHLTQDANGFNGTGFQLKKGVNPKDPTAGGPTTSKGQTGCIVFRYAEALLNYAEAKAELGEAVDYEKSLNLLRRRAGMPDFDKTLQDPSRKHYADFGYPVSDELYEIRRERAVELASEGFRTQDYRRWAAHALFAGKRPKGYPFNPEEFKNNEGKVTVTTARDENGFMDPLQKGLPNGYQFDPDRDYLDFIPVNERTLNPKLTQNPGWEE